MKKKGLIISTAVMVVVLIAALTTGTFAWFSTSSEVTIQDMNFNVAAASNVKIGVRQQTGAAANSTGYIHGAGLAYGTSTGFWSSGTSGLGSEIEFANPLNLTVSAGVGSSNSKTEGPDQKPKMDETYTYGLSSTLYKASGNNFNTLGDLTAAVINNTSNENGSDVVDLQMGISSAKSDIVKTFCTIEIEIDTAKQDVIGMISALRLEIQVGEDTSKTYGHKSDNNDGDIFGEKHYYSPVSSDSSAIQVEETTKYKFVFYFWIDESGATTVKVTPFRIRAFISGYDEDCDIAATGSEATIRIGFDGLPASDNIEKANGWDTKWQQLTLTDQTKA